MFFFGIYFDSYRYLIFIVMVFKGIKLYDL